MHCLGLSTGPHVPEKDKKDTHRKLIKFSGGAHDLQQVLEAAVGRHAADQEVHSLMVKVVHRRDLASWRAHNAAFYVNAHTASILHRSHL
jgi:hypothetical protein